MVKLQVFSCFFCLFWL